MTIWTIIRILPGICLRISDTKKLEQAVTKVTARHITSVTFKLEVTAKAEQIPNICSAIGLFLIIGLVRASLIVDIVYAFP